MDYDIKNILSDRPLATLSIISFFLFSLKWLLSFYYFPDEEIIMRIINDSYHESHMYFHYIKSFADLSFNNIYNTTSLETDLKVLPIGAIFIHTIFFKIFGNLSNIV